MARHQQLVRHSQNWNGEMYPVLQDFTENHYDGSLLNIPTEYLNLVPESVAREHVVLPLGRQGETIYLAAVHGRTCASFGL